MPEREARLARDRAAARKAAQAASAEVLLERGVGEPLLAPRAPEAASLLRPQQSRNVVWRWHVRRRPRAR